MTVKDVLDRIVADVTADLDLTGEVTRADVVLMTEIVAEALAASQAPVES